jgi:hypothetical protein
MAWTLYRTEELNPCKKLIFINQLEQGKRKIASKMAGQCSTRSANTGLETGKK